MSVTISRTDGVTVFTMISDPDSRWPPLCQILRSLCYGPVCCSMSQQLRNIQRASQSVHGAMHIIIGLLHIGLGTILLLSYSGYWFLYDTYFPVWLGSLFICSTAYMWGNLYLWYFCDQSDYYLSYMRTAGCLEGNSLALMLLKGIVGALIVLSVVELCVSISSAGLWIKALRRTSKEQNKTSDDPEYYKPLLEEVTTGPAA
uniref:Membrane-spanning 4-domains subfamily A member 8 n=1 Tax=Fundulus heteroclitus TaxID=8078 RepID=A0A3Q2T7Y1_FUNHE